jgi:hypothetical protein
VLQEHGLRAGPAAPDAAEEGGNKEERKAESRDDEEEQPHVLRGEGEAEQVEAALRHIEEDRRGSR